MRIFRYHFTEYGEMPKDYKPQTREVVAANAGHARFRIQTQHPPTAPNRYWQITKTEIIDLELVPPGYIPPKWIWSKRWRAKFKSDIGHCIREIEHMPHVYRTEAGRAKVCPGNERVLVVAELEEQQATTLLRAREKLEEALSKPHVSLDNYNKLKSMGYIDKQVARHWGLAVDELHILLDMLQQKARE